jgi:hypothetical protein
MGEKARVEANLILPKKASLFWQVKTGNASPMGWRFLLCVLLGEREKSHKDWLPFG